MVFKVVIVMNTVATVPSCLMKYLYSGVIDLARGYNVIQYKESVILDQNYVRSYAGIRSHNYYESDLEDLSVLDHIL